MKRALSFLLVLVGGLLLYWGVGLQKALDTGQVHPVTGEPPEAVIQYSITGVVALLLGAYGLWKYRG